MVLRAVVSHWKFVGTEHQQSTCYSWWYCLNSGESLIDVTHWLSSVSRENIESVLFMNIHPESSNIIFLYVIVSLLCPGQPCVSTQDSMISPQNSATRNFPRSSMTYLNHSKVEVYNISFAPNVNNKWSTILWSSLVKKIHSWNYYTEQLCCCYCCC